MNGQSNELAGELLYGLPAIAAHLGLNTRKVRHQIERSGLPIFRIGGVICARTSSVMRWLAECEAKAVSAVETSPPTAPSPLQGGCETSSAPHSGSSPD